MLLSQAENKTKLRKLFAEKRKSLSAKEKKDFSDRLCKNICSLEAFKDADAVLSFWPLENETDVKAFNAAVLELGKILALPRCVKGTQKMNFYTVKSFDELEKGSYSIFEPKEECPLFVPSAEVKAVCIVPAMSYDASGFRLGYGVGFYDRYLAKYNLTTVGAVYHPFLVESLPHGEFDIAVDTVVTDKEIIKINRCAVDAATTGK